MVQNDQATNNQQTTNHQTTASQFDPSTLPPEALAWVDRQRTQASQTTRRNLMRDESFINEMRTQLQPEVQRTVEEQNQDRINALEKMVAESRVNELLSRAGIPDEQISQYTDLFATSNIEESVSRATNFVSLYQNTVQLNQQVAQAQAVVNMTTPQAPQNTITEQDSLQAEYDEAKKDTSYMRDVNMARIQRIASEKGIILK